jgi:hypothetical protein
VGMDYNILNLPLLSLSICDSAEDAVEPETGTSSCLCRGRIDDGLPLGSPRSTLTCPRVRPPLSIVFSLPSRDVGRGSREYRHESSTQRVLHWSQGKMPSHLALRFLQLSQAWATRRRKRGSTFARGIALI